MVIKVLVSIPQDVLEAEDIAEAILYGLTAPPRVDVSVTILMVHLSTLKTLRLKHSTKRL